MTLLFFACNTWPLNSVICVSLTNTSIINTWITSAINFYVSDQKIDRDFHVYLFGSKSQACNRLPNMRRFKLHNEISNRCIRRMSPWWQVVIQGSM